MNSITDKALPKGTQLRGPKRTYVLQEVLGSGSFGITYRATYTQQDGNITQKLDCAIKEYFPGCYCTRNGLNVAPHSSDAELFRGGKDDFVSEANKLHGLGTQGDHIVKVNEVFEANGTAYYVMQYVDGSPLTDVVPRRGLPYNQAIGLLQPIMNAVAFLHHKRINHLDIKPDNIMVTRDEQPVLIDFGQSMHFKGSGKGTSTKKVPGATDGFAPPEQYAGIQTFSPKSDIYALTATLCYMLTGRALPKSTELTRTAIEDALRDKLPQEGLMDAFHRGLARSAEDRTASVEQLMTDLGIENARQTTGPVTNNTKVISNNSPARWLKDHVTALSAAAIGIVVAVAVVLLLILKPWTSNAPTTTPDNPVVHTGGGNTNTGTGGTSNSGGSTTTDVTPTSQPTQSAKTLNLGYGTWVGGVKNGEPDGEGRLTYTQKHRVANVGLDYTEASPGDYVDALYEEGEFCGGELYDSNGHKKATIIP